MGGGAKSDYGRKCVFFFFAGTFSDADSMSYVFYDTFCPLYAESPSLSLNGDASSGSSLAAFVSSSGNIPALLLPAAEPLKPNHRQTKSLDETPGQSNGSAGGLQASAKVSNI
jgi:hypothetical protein